MCILRPPCLMIITGITSYICVQSECPRPQVKPLNVESRPVPRTLDIWVMPEYKTRPNNSAIKLQFQICLLYTTVWLQLVDAWFSSTEDAPFLNISFPCIIVIWHLKRPTRPGILTNLQGPFKGGKGFLSKDVRLSLAMLQDHNLL